MSTNAENSVASGKHTLSILSRTSTESFPSASRTFAKIIPANEKARNAFHQAFSYLDEGNYYHKQFMAIDSSSVVNESRLEYYDTTDEEYDTDLSGHSRSKEHNLHGAFKLSLGTLPSLTGCAIWRLGKGYSRALDFRGIEILLVRPSQKEAKEISAVHAAIQLHANSGAFVLTAGSDKPVWFEVDNEEIRLLNYAQIVLSKPTNKIRIGELEYKIKFDVSNMTAFVQERNMILKTCYRQDPPHPKLDEIPQPNHTRLGHAIIHNSLGFGGSGWVYIGIDSVTGHPLAVKELRVRQTDHTMMLAENEVSISRRFKQVCLLS